MSRMNEDHAAAPPSADFLSRQVESSRVFFFEENAASSDFAIRCGGFERCRPDYRIDRPDFPWFLLEFVHAGGGELTLGGVTTRLQPGTFFLYGPGNPHRIVTDPKQPLQKYFVGFSGTAAATFLETHELAPPIVSQSLQPAPIHAAFETLVARGQRNSRYSPPLCTAIVQQLLLMCREDTVDAGTTDTRAYATYSRVRQFIAERFLEFGSLDAVAAACGLDAPYLCRLFGRFHDESPYQFLTRLRMRHAASLLLEGGLSVKKAAAACGFADPYHFSRLFKSIHRIPPSRYRDAMLTKNPR